MNSATWPPMPAPTAADAAPALRWPLPLAALWLGLGYAAAAVFSLYVGRQPGTIAVVWFANALAVVALLHRPRAQWPALLGAVGVANWLANRLWGDSWGGAALFVLPNLLEVGLGAWLLQRQGLGQLHLGGPRTLLRLWVLGGFLPQLAGAALGASLLALVAGAPLAITALHWLQGAVLGAVSVLPLLFLARRLPRAQLLALMAQGRLLAMLALACGLTLLCLAHVPYPFVYIALPITLAALVLEAVQVALLVLAVAVVIALAIALGVFVPPPVTSEWEQSFLYVAYAAALVPAQLLAAALAALRDTNARLLAHGQALRRSNESLEQFVRIASHDLREPVNTVVQFSGLIQQDMGASLPPDARQYLALVHKAATRMRTLLDDVLQYTRLQAGAPGPAQPVALDELLQEVREALAARLRSSRGQLLAEPLPVVRGQRALLSLLLQNLVGNALKFVPPGRVPQVTVSARLAEGQAWVTVADNGIGIAPDDLPRLFRPFQRLHLRRDYEGTGLGLALCREVAQAHGGEISVASVPGEGSRFTVRLPLA